MPHGVLSIVVFIGLTASGCNGSCDWPSPGRRVSEGAASTTPTAPTRRRTRKTTSESIAVTNLDSEIEELRRRSASHQTISMATSLVEKLLSRVQFYGTFDDFDEALRISKGAVERWPEDPVALLLRARVLNALHQFDEARALIDEARAQQQKGPLRTGARGSTLEQEATNLEATMDLAQGVALREVLERRHELVSSEPSYQHLNGLAATHAKLGEFDRADEFYEQAVRGYRDVSPFPLAWVAFQRGVMWSEQAHQPDRGRAFYEEALGYLPNYVLANVHLAELEAASGDRDHAVMRLQAVAARTQDPEPLAVLSKIVEDSEEAEHYEGMAVTQYLALRDRWPKAFEHHFEHVMGPGAELSSCTTR